MAKVDIEALKALHKTSKIYHLAIPTDDGIKDLYLKKIDRLTFKAAMRMMEKDELDAAVMILKSLTVEGPVDEIIEDFDDLRAASQLLVEVIGVRTGNVVVL
jgi:hypothetical protein